jgi:hypothetical protein
MREIDHDHIPWHLEPTTPGVEERFRKWNLIIAMTLAFLVLGILVAAAVMAENNLKANSIKTKQVSQLLLLNKPDKYAARATKQSNQFCVRAE